MPVAYVKRGSERSVDHAVFPAGSGICGRRAAGIAVCAHAFVTGKPEDWTGTEVNECEGRRLLSDRPHGNIRKKIKGQANRHSAGWVPCLCAADGGRGHPIGGGFPRDFARRGG